MKVKLGQVKQIEQDHTARAGEPGFKPMLMHSKSTLFCFSAFCYYLFIFLLTLYFYLVSGLKVVRKKISCMPFTQVSQMLTFWHTYIWLTIFVLSMYCRHNTSFSKYFSVFSKNKEFAYIAIVQSLKSGHSYCYNNII